jgi:hypothetical protein
LLFAEASNAQSTRPSGSDDHALKTNGTQFSDDAGTVSLNHPLAANLEKLEKHA